MAGTYRSEYTGAQIDAAVAFGHNPDSTPTANSVAGVTSGGVKAALDAETNARQAADTTLQNNINAEASARQAADTTLQNNINAEAAARQSQDNVLSGAIGRVGDKVLAETAAREQADTQLGQEINAEHQEREAEDLSIRAGLDGKQAKLTNQVFFNVLDDIGAPELHRMIYRGKNLGTSFTAAQKAAIANGSFDDLWLGDYWVIGGVTYVIADFDYWYNTGNTAFTKHHVVVIPKKNMYNAQMNASNITTGGYYGSAMRGADVEGTFTPYAQGCGLYNALTAFQNAFGDALLTHREYLCNAVTDGKESGGAWFDSVIDLPSEIMIYGTSIRAASPRLATIDKSQLAFFAASQKLITQEREYYWLRDVVSALYFAAVDQDGTAGRYPASNSLGVRPVAAVGG